MQLSSKHAPNHFILHVGTNNLDSDKIAKSMVNIIIDLTTSLKNDKDDRSISNVITRTDKANLNEKGCLVNSISAEICKEKNIPY